MTFKLVYLQIKSGEVEGASAAREGGWLKLTLLPPGKDKYLGTDGALWLSGTLAAVSCGGIASRRIIELDLR
jgi:hypothetical protein